VGTGVGVDCIGFTVGVGVASTFAATVGGGVVVIASGVDDGLGVAVGDSTVSVVSAVIGIPAFLCGCVGSFVGVAAARGAIAVLATLHRHTNTMSDKHPMAILPKRLRPQISFTRCMVPLCKRKRSALIVVGLARQ
jgi:hypothetical protein